MTKTALDKIAEITKSLLEISTIIRVTINKETDSGIVYIRVDTNDSRVISVAVTYEELALGNVTITGSRVVNFILNEIEK